MEVLAGRPNTPRWSDEWWEQPSEVRISGLYYHYRKHLFWLPLRTRYEFSSLRPTILHYLLTWRKLQFHPAIGSRSFRLIFQPGRDWEEEEAFLCRCHYSCPLCWVTAPLQQRREANFPWRPATVKRLHFLCLAAKPWIDPETYWFHWSLAKPGLASDSLKNYCSVDAALTWKLRTGIRRSWSTAYVRPRDLRFPESSSPGLLSRKAAMAMWIISVYCFAGSGGCCYYLKHCFLRKHWQDWIPTAQFSRSEGIKNIFSRKSSMFWWGWFVWSNCEEKCCCWLFICCCWLCICSWRATSGLLLKQDVTLLTLCTGPVPRREVDGCISTRKLTRLARMSCLEEIRPRLKMQAKISSPTRSLD